MRSIRSQSERQRKGKKKIVFLQQQRIRVLIGCVTAQRFARVSVYGRRIGHALLRLRLGGARPDEPELFEFVQLRLLLRQLDRRNALLFGQLTLLPQRNLG
jgi:hypothetical protein